MTTLSRLRLLFHAAALSGVAAGDAGCAESEDASTQTEPPYPRDAFTLDACGGAGSFDPLPVLAASAPNDSVTMRTLPFVNAPSDASIDPAALRTEGTPCATATAPTVCEESLASQPIEGGFRHDVDLGSGHDFVVTSGDSVTRLADPAALRAFVGTVESAAEAALVALHGPTSTLVYGLDCSQPNARPVEGGFELVLGSGIACGLGNDRYESLVRVATDGTVTVVSTRVIARGTDGCAIGRLTDGLAPSLRPPPTTLGAFLAEMAELEASAVIAFERLAHELEALDAPLDLVSRARRSARDERRHAAMVAKLARRFGGTPIAPTATSMPLRDARAIACENAEEGLVRESFGAGLAAYQALHAEEATLARLFGALAHDEARHAALSVDLARWLDARLDRASRDAALEARERAEARFRAQLDHAMPEPLRRSLGLPTPAGARRLFDAVMPGVRALASA